MIVSVLLYHKHASGQIALPASTIHGQSAPIRTYDLIENMVEVRGEPFLVSHDADILCDLGYVLATAAQQDAYAARKRGDAEFHEVAEKREEFTESTKTKRPYTKRKV